MVPGPCPPRVPGLLVVGALVLFTCGCTTGGESPTLGALPRLQLPRGADPVYTGDTSMVYRTVFEAVVAEFDTAPRIVKPERGLLVFQEAGTDTNTSVLVTTAGESATAVHIETHGDRGLLTGRGASAVRSRLINALDERLARAEHVEPAAPGPRGTSALAEKQDALQRIQAALGFQVLPAYLVDMEAADLNHLAAAIDEHVGMREMTAEERRTSGEFALAWAKELHDGGRYEEAADLLEHAVTLLPGSAVAHCNLGEIYKHLRDFDRCLEHLHTARSLDSGYVETYINLGIVYDDYVIDDAKALENYRTYLKLGGTDPRVAAWIDKLENGG